MSSYYDFVVVPVPVANLEAYRKQSEVFGRLCRKHGAIEYVEAIGEDVQPGKVTSFPLAVQLQDGETIACSFIRYGSRAARDKAFASVMEEPEMKGMKDMPFDGKRMFWGGFDELVRL